MGKIFFDFIKCKIIYYYFSQTSSHSIYEHSNFVIDGDFFNIFINIVYLLALAIYFNLFKIKERFYFFITDFMVL